MVPESQSSSAHPMGGQVTFTSRTVDRGLAYFKCFADSPRVNREVMNRRLHLCCDYLKTNNNISEHETQHTFRLLSKCISRR